MLGLVGLNSSSTIYNSYKDINSYMFDFLIKFSLNNRFKIIIFFGVITLIGVYTAVSLEIDVLPDLNKPRVTILTEAHGLAPEEVETLVTMPLEYALNGTEGSIGIKSQSGIGISMIYVEFDWGTDIHKARQLINERLDQVKERLPPETSTALGPISSIMGEIQYVGLFRKEENTNTASQMELKDLATKLIQPKIMAISGVSNVIVMGGEKKQYHILISPEKLNKYHISLESFVTSLKFMSVKTTGGYLERNDKEFLIRPLAHIKSIEDINLTVVGRHLGNYIYVKDVAEVAIGTKVKRGEASVNGKNAVILTIQKQPKANTLDLTEKIDKTLVDLNSSLPEGIYIKSDLFKQSRFIETAINNVLEALKDGTIMVAIILILFLANVRTTFITLLAIPLSFLITLIIFYLLELSINTMTLGGFAIAIGELVDDAIVDVENVFRRLKQNYRSNNKKSIFKVVYQASLEIRSSIVVSTFIVILVFVPLLALGGIEGRLFQPLGISYIVSILASLFVATTITPVLCYLMLPSIARQSSREGIVIETTKKWVKPLVTFSLSYPKIVILGSSILLGYALYLIPQMGRDFLPKFNETTATIGVASYPGIALTASNQLGKNIEKAIMSVKEVKSTIRRTGRAEMDEHAEGLHWHEIDVDFHPFTRKRSQVLNDIRENILKTGDLYVDIGQPISHRLDHLLSGVRSELAIKVFGPDLPKLRMIAGDIHDVMEKVKGLVDLQIEPLVTIPQLKIEADRAEAAKYGINPGILAESLELAFNGSVVSNIWENDNISREVFVRLNEKTRSDPEKIKKIVVKTLPSGKKIRLSDVSNIYDSSGPNKINRENVQRRLIVQANTFERDVYNVVTEIKEKIEKSVEVPEGYYIRYEGLYEAQQRSLKRTVLLGAISLFLVFLLLYFKFRSLIFCIQIMLNIPLALIGSVYAVYYSDPILSMSTLVAFITLCGIATRNGILMIGHYIYLLKNKGLAFSKETITKGTLERIIPVFMTAFTAILALIPILLSKGEPGKEILHPVAVVIVGGLLSSTILDIFVTPTIFYNYGKKASKRLLLSIKESLR